MKMRLIPQKEFDRLKKANLEKNDQLELIADMCRLNTLFAVKKAGSGHLGSSFSAMDIVVYLLHHYLNLKDVGPDDLNRDIYFSSKGHDVPGHYSVLHSLGIVSEEKLMQLRRLGGLDGHPDVKIPGIEANTGSLGMGISKGRGMLFAKHYQKRKGKVIVLVGDGEFQEGQNFEALQSTPQQGANELIVVMDHNKLQSDRYIDRIVSLRNLDEKIASFGWHVSRIDGHDYRKLEDTFHEFERITDKPKFLICDTIKGRGVSFMEHPRALQENQGFYRWHAGAPADEPFQKAFDELQDRVIQKFEKFGLGTPQFKDIDTGPKQASGMSDELVAQAYGDKLVELAKTNKNFIILDADLSLDCKLREFEDTYPDRFIETGIAEQDMVSMAGGIALQGLVPVVNSFCNFLSARANEQTYNNMTENRKIIYVGHYAGLIPAGPGKSHQSLRDISLYGAFPNCTILQAANADEIKMITDYAINHSPESCMIRINIAPSPRVVPLPKDYRLELGKGVRITEGSDLALFAYGPVMLHEALVAQELLKAKGVDLRVVNMPWLNRFDRNWIKGEVEGLKKLFILEDHSSFGGLGDQLMSFLNREKLFKGQFEFHKWGIDEYPACGTPAQALDYHKVSGARLVERILSDSN